MDALTGVDGRLEAIDPRQAVQLRLDRLRAQAEAGELDTATLPSSPTIPSPSSPNTERNRP